MSIATSVPGIISFSFLSFPFLIKEQHEEGEVRFQLWVPTDMGSSFNSATDELRDLGQVHFSLLLRVFYLYQVIFKGPYAWL